MLTVCRITQKAVIFHKSKLNFTFYKLSLYAKNSDNNTWRFVMEFGGGMEAG